jgi:RimJ/RimL family protein N-acetyltransferase
MTESSAHHDLPQDSPKPAPNEEVQLAVTGQQVGLGPLRKELIPQYQRWINTPEVRAGVGNHQLFTAEAEQGWYDEAAKIQEGRASFTAYDLIDMHPVGTTALMSIDHVHGTALFGILLGERRGQGLGTEATHLTLDWAFTILGLHNVLLEALPWNKGALRAYEKAGFRLIGHRRGSHLSMGERVDVVIMDAVAGEFTGSVLRREG